MGDQYLRDALERGRPDGPCRCNCGCPLHSYHDDERCVWCRHGDHAEPAREIPAGETREPLAFAYDELELVAAAYDRRVVELLRVSELHATCVSLTPRGEEVMADGE